MLQVTGSLRVGGLENVAMNFWRFCDKSKYSFDFLVYGDAVEPLEAEAQKLGARVFHIPYPHKGVGKYTREMKRVMREYGPYDVVHSHSLFNSGFVMKAAARTGIPVRIAHAHSDRRKTKTKFPRSWYNVYMRALINRYSTQKFACSEGAGLYLYDKGYDESVYIVKNAVCVDNFKYDAEKRAQVKREFGWENCKIVGHIGRLVEVKNQKRIVEVFAAAYERDRSLRLLIAGDGELKETLQRQIDDLGLTDVARLAGTRSDVAALLSAFDVYMMPSFYEGVSISLVEAQSSGAWCLVSANAAAKETRLTENLTILELDESNEVWRDSLLSLLGKERAVNSAAEVAEKGYDIVGVVDKALKFYGEKR